MPGLETWSGFEIFTVEITMKDVTEIGEPLRDRIKSILTYYL